MLTKLCCYAKGGICIKFLMIDIGYDCEELNEPLGLEALHSYLYENMKDIEIYTHCASIEKTNYTNLLNSVCPDIVGISTHINTWSRFNEFYTAYVEYCSSHYVEPIIIVGGILGTYEYELLLDNYSNVICSIGEGEYSLLQVLRIAKNNENCEFETLLSIIHSNSCVNLAYKFNGEILCTRRQALSPLPDITNKYSHKYLPSILNNGGIARIEASRGCPWNCCSFCVLDWKYAGSKWRPYHWSKVIPEIIDMSNQGANTIYFTDEEFLGGDYQRIQEFINHIQLLKQNNILKNDLEFIASTSTRAILGKYGMGKKAAKECLIQLKNIGFRCFFIGIESGSDSQLKRFKKGCTVNENEEALALLRNLSIEADIGYILFDPLLTVQELSESLEFLKRNNLDMHISRFAKKLRLVPHTAFSNYPNIIFEQYDHNSVELRYRFSDPYIQKIYDCYSYWEASRLTETHTVQAKIRALGSSPKRDIMINLLEKMRKTEFDTLKALVTLAQTMPDFINQHQDAILVQVSDLLTINPHGKGDQNE